MNPFSSPPLQLLRIASNLRLFFTACILGGSTVAATAAQLDQSTLFEAGRDGYHTYRIPVLVASTEGSLLAFCEGRHASSGDAGKIDLVLKRSTDGGRTWSPQHIVWSDGANTCGNPAPVIDHATGAIWLLMTWNLGADRERDIMQGTSKDTRKVFVTHSTDDGITWAAPRDITTAVKKPHWRWYATGPANGIQLERGAHKGRLVVPANHSDHSDSARHPYRAHVLYSDDHGSTWDLGGVQEDRTNESTVVELEEGSLLQNMRSYHGKNRRAIATSSDAGASWGKVTLHDGLIDSVCQASLVRYSWPAAGVPGRLLFSNPASTRRERLTVQLSLDDGRSWPVQKVLHAGPAAYSSLAALPNGMIFCLYEAGEKHAYESIVLARFSIDWLSR